MGVSKQIIWTFFVLLNGCSLDAKVFMIIKILRRKWSKQKLGTEHSNYIHVHVLADYRNIVGN